MTSARETLGAVPSVTVRETACDDQMRLAIFIPSFGDGGVERMLVNMVIGLAARGVDVVFFTGRPDGPHLEKLAGHARIEYFPQSPWPLQVLRLRRELVKHPVDAVLAAKLNDASVAVTVKRLLGGTPPVILRPGTAVTERLAGRSRFTRWRKLGRMRRVYRQADAVVANSQGVRADVARATGLSPDSIDLVRNPVISPAFHTLASEPTNDTWLAADMPRPPVILGMGGLRRQKDFETLIRAFALVREKRDCRLLILGEGQLRHRLESLIQDLGLSGFARLPGFVENPYPLLAAADLFVLSSRWEGSPNVLTEALALGTPVVATDCRSGPAEILRNGEVAPLVPVGDVSAMATEIEKTLSRRPDPLALKAATEAYTVEANAAAYHELLISLRPEGDGNA